MVVFKRKQIVVLALALMIVITGYLQYSYNRSSLASRDENKGRLGEAVYVDNEGLDGEPVDGEIDEANEDNGKEGVPASNTGGNYFAQAKLDREITRSRNSDSYKQITEDVNVSEEVRTEAYDKMMLIIDNTEKEMRLENLIREKGFSDVMAMFGDDGSIDIIVEAKSLTQSDVAQITDLAIRHAGVEVNDLKIKNVY